MNIDFPISFTKMSGTGNDFIIIDHREPFLADGDLSEFARLICRRKFSVGADGLILIENSETADFRWKFFNGDGSVAEMCGNGARCAARFAFEKKIAPAGMRFLTMAGVIEAQVVGESVRIRMTPPTDIALDRKVPVNDTEVMARCINTGVPHAVLFTDAVESAPVVELGRSIRRHAMFQPAGTNVNFVKKKSRSELYVRTYERGVEDETMACGTGAVAAALVAGLLGEVDAPVTIVTSGGEKLIIHYALTGQSEAPAKDVFLEGPANFIYEGQLNAEALRS